jgi:hypothetical protein
MDFDEMKNQTEKLAGEHPDQVDQAVDKTVDSGADVAKEKVGHDDQVDQGAGKLKSFFRRKS